MNNDKCGTIYSITNKESGRVYIGATTNYVERTRAHKGKIRRTYHDNEGISVDAALYGEDSFIFNKLISCTKEELYDLEIETIKKYREVLGDKVYNFDNKHTNYCMWTKKYKGYSNGYVASIEKDISEARHSSLSVIQYAVSILDACDYDSAISVLIEATNLARIARDASRKLSVAKSKIKELAS